MTREGDAPTCPLCGETMREERGMARENLGMVERWWMCPSCLHRMVTIHRMVTTEDMGEGENGLQHTEHPGE